MKKNVLVLTVEETRLINGALNFIAGQFAKASWRDGKDVYDLAMDYELLNARIAQVDPVETDLPYTAEVDDITKALCAARINRLAEGKGEQ